MRADPGQAFVAGLLHDIGRLILVLNDPEHYGEVLDYQKANKCHIRLAERAVLGFEHTEVGRGLAEHWKLPLIIQTAISAHHEPTQKNGGAIASVVQLADKMTCILVENDEEPPDLELQSDSDICKSFGINEKVFEEVLDSAKLQYNEISGFLLP